MIWFFQLVLCYGSRDRILILFLSMVFWTASALFWRLKTPFLSDLVDFVCGMSHGNYRIRNYKLKNVLQSVIYYLIINLKHG